MRTLLSLLLFASSFLSIARSEEPPPFEGRMVYEIMSGEMSMTYTLWFKGDKWRSELRSGAQVYELRLGDKAERVAYLVNEGGESYRQLGGGPPGGGQAGGPPPGGMGPPPGKKKGGKKGKAPKPVDLEKHVALKDETGSVMGFETHLELLKGSGKKLKFWWAESELSVPALALPRVKVFEEKQQLLMAYFNEHSGLPLMVDAGLSGKKAFTMQAVSLDEEPIEDSFVSLPEGYKLEGGMMMPGGGGGKSRRGPPGGGPGGGGPGGGMPPM